MIASQSSSVVSSSALECAPAIAALATKMSRRPRSTRGRDEALDVGRARDVRLDVAAALAQQLAGARAALARALPRGRPRSRARPRRRSATRSRGRCRSWRR